MRLLGKTSGYSLGSAILVGRVAKCCRRQRRRPAHWLFKQYIPHVLALVPISCWAAACSPAKTTQRVRPWLSEPTRSGLAQQRLIALLASCVVCQWFWLAYRLAHGLCTGAPWPLCGGWLLGMFNIPVQVHSVSVLPCASATAGRSVPGSAVMCCAVTVMPCGACDCLPLAACIYKGLDHALQPVAVSTSDTSLCMWPHVIHPCLLAVRLPLAGLAPAAIWALAGVPAAREVLAINPMDLVWMALSALPAVVWCCFSWSWPQYSQYETL